MPTHSKALGKTNNYCQNQIAIVTYMQVFDNGIVKTKSAHSFQETFERLQSNVTSRGLIVFATINFSEDAVMIRG